MKMKHRDRIDDLRTQLRAVAGMAGSADRDTYNCDGLAAVLHGIADGLDKIAREAAKQDRKKQEANA
ncbi:MAG: hypothetical protein K9L88_07695 [Chromatiaceae bacterium]|nr:hypothetical protein [Chromatiaceae bacterium]